MSELAPYATSNASSRGRRHPEAPPNNRSEFQRDRDRIVHSAAFRRLEYKTQVFVNHEGDMFRTRLTHSLEVAQIGRTIARALQANEELTEAISLAHDLGHTPFGHAGQDALNDCMRDYGGFEHNLQSLRIVDHLEEKYAEFNGLNLTFETREGILKHCSVKNAQQLGDIGERFLKKQQPGLEAQIANFADEIAYNNHDVDDGLRAGLLSIEQMREVDLFNQQYEEVMQQYPAISERRAIHEIIRRMINRQITDFLAATSAQIKSVNPACADDIKQLPAPIAVYSDEMQGKTRQLKKTLRTSLYQHYRVHRMSTKAKLVIKSLFQAFMDDIRLLPTDTCKNASIEYNASGDGARAVVIADYIAGMTDRYAIREYERIFDPIKLT
ncbi:MAG: deoxyguanosinetriphosphate triphosphohydrolase [Gammaproteobacteria bacterium]|nr:deoxyguanosinetriphosphate triphosphohydrolase [Gammaproteobacteria bacterium]